MKRIIKPVIFLIGLFIAFTTTAQENTPVQFNFSAFRNEKGEAFISVKAKINKGAILFSAKKQKPEDAFVSTVQFDSVAQKLLTGDLKEIGNIKTASGADYNNESVRFFEDSVEWKQQITVDKNDSASLKGTVTWLAKSGETFESGDKEFKVKMPAYKEGGKEAKSPWSIFWLCLGLGLLAVITPCVFPLVPVTVSFFLKRSKSRAEGIRNAVWYSLSIILIYTIPTLLLTIAFGDDVMNKLSTSPISNLLFFTIFILFAISFFGAFDITLPNSWANKADEKAGKGGLIGVFFMALTLVIVSFSCTGPIIASLLSQTSTQGVSAAPVMGMLGFGLGLALPFSLFAFFPSMLQSLPKSGGWLNTVKVTFGFIELALALKFLSNVDLAYHWRLLDRDIFLVIWIVIFVLLGFYLLGKLKFSHDSDLPYISVPRLFFAMGSFCFALYLFPGLWGAPLKGIGGWLPPSHTQDFNLNDLKYKLEEFNNDGGKNRIDTGSFSSENLKTALPPKKYTDVLHMPFGIKAYFDLEEGMAAAKILKRPVMLDFTGHSCANCRKMEAEVWENPEVLRMLKNDFVIVSLYIDESTELPEGEQYSNADGEKITTVGEKNLAYEKTKFGINAQPLYMFLDLNGEPLSNERVGYVSKDKFLSHLKAVKEEFKRR